MATGIDTLQLFERFKAADLTDKAAKEIAETFKEVEQTRLDELATKGDLKELEARIEANIIKWVAAMLVAQAAVIAALVKLL
jgi:hypothetical protein